MKAQALKPSNVQPLTKTDDQAHTLQLDLPVPRLLTGLLTTVTSSAEEHFTLATSLDGSDFVDYQENGATKVFAAGSSPHACADSPDRA